MKYENLHLDFKNNEAGQTRSKQNNKIRRQNFYFIQMDCGCRSWNVCLFNYRQRGREILNAFCYLPQFNGLLLLFLSWVSPKNYYSCILVKTRQIITFFFCFLIEPKKIVEEEIRKKSSWYKNVVKQIRNQTYRHAIILFRRDPITSWEPCWELLDCLLYSQLYSLCF